MESCLVKELNLRYEPVAILLSNERPKTRFRVKKVGGAAPFRCLLRQQREKLQSLSAKPRNVSAVKSDLDLVNLPIIQAGLNIFYRLEKPAYLKEKGIKKTRN
jgi:hypothetical protein